MKPTIVVGDIHGRMEYVQAALSLVDRYNIVFVGDNMDSWDRNPIAGVECLIAVCEAHEQFGERVRVTWSNHDLSYLKGQLCSGYNGAMQLHLNAYGLDRLYSNLEPYVWLEGAFKPILITHAGLSATKVDPNQHPLQITQQMIKQFFGEVTDETLWSVGRHRGGKSAVGGIIWCDFWREFVPIPAIRQIVGHSSRRPKRVPAGPVEYYGNWNVDCLHEVPHVVCVDAVGDISVLSLAGHEGVEWR